MITEVHIQNYRSIVDQRVKLHPFTLLVGQNGAGKSNFLECFHQIETNLKTAYQYNVDHSGRVMYMLDKHINHLDARQTFDFRYSDGSKARFEEIELSRTSFAPRGLLTMDWEKHAGKTAVYSIDATLVGKEEKVTANPGIVFNGEGTVQTLESLKTGDREDLFNEIERLFRELIPEAEKISFVPGDGGKRIQVREKHIDKPILLSELSEGTRLVLTILTILHQENAPQVIGLEDIDRGLHPRLYEQVIQLCRRITEEKGVQIIATTHNPYLVDQFKDHEEAVLIVEKTNGETTFTPLSERIAKFKDLDLADQPLGKMWYQGLVGGVPKLAY